MQLTIADVNTKRAYHFEADDKDNSPNTEHLGFDTSQMAAIPKAWNTLRDFCPDFPRFYSLNKLRLVEERLQITADRFHRKLRSVLWSHTPIF